MRTHARKLALRKAMALAVWFGTGIAAAAGGGPEPVHIGVYLIDVYGLSVRESTYQADFYLWMRWTGDLDPTEFEVLNGQLEQKSDPDFDQVGKVKYVSYRCRALVHTNLDPVNYPWDEHVLSLQIENANHDASRMRLLADEQESRCDPDLAIGDWTVGPMQCYVRPVTYETNYGHPGRAPGARASYSRFYVDLPIRHQGAMPYLKTFVVLFIAVAIAFLAFLIGPHSAEARFAILVPSVFGAITSLILVTDRIAPTTRLAMSERIHYLGIFFVFLSMLESAIATRLWHANRHAEAHRWDRWSAVLFPVGFVLVVIVASVKW